METVVNDAILSPAKQQLKVRSPKPLPLRLSTLPAVNFRRRQRDVAVVAVPKVKVATVASNKPVMQVDTAVFQSHTTPPPLPPVRRPQARGQLNRAAPGATVLASLDSARSSSKAVASNPIAVKSANRVTSVNPTVTAKSVAQITPNALGSVSRRAMPPTNLRQPLLRSPAAVGGMQRHSPASTPSTNYRPIITHSQHHTAREEYERLPSVPWGQVRSGGIVTEPEVL